IVFDGKHRSSSFPIRRSWVDDQHFPVNGKVLGAAIDAGGVSDVYLNSGFLHFLISQRHKPLGSLGATPTGINDEISSQFFLTGFSMAMSQMHTCHTGGDIIGTQSSNLTLIDKAHIGFSGQTAAYTLFEERTALAVSFDIAWKSCFPHSKVVPTDIGDATNVGSSTLGERSRQVREKSCQKGATLVKQNMDGLPLGIPSPCTPIFCKPIALNERDVVEVV